LELRRIGEESRRELLKVIGGIQEELTHAVLAGDKDAIRVAEIVWDKLDDETRRKLLPHLLKIIIERAKKISVTGLKLKRKIGSYSFDSDEICIDSTIDRSAVKIILNLLEYEDILVSKKEEVRRCIALMLDKSGSMVGEKLFLAASITATIALTSYRYNYDYSLIVFDEDTRIIKKFGENKNVREVVESVLLLKPYGCTDIARALECGLKELMKCKFLDRVGLILTDGFYNMGDNPEEKARLFPKLNVLCLPKGDLKTCENLAKLGKGKLIKMVKEIDLITI